MHARYSPNSVNPESKCARTSMFIPPQASTAEMILDTYLDTLLMGVGRNKFICLADPVLPQNTYFLSKRCSWDRNQMIPTNRYQRKAKLFDLHRSLGEETSSFFFWFPSADCSLLVIRMADSGLFTHTPNNATCFSFWHSICRHTPRARRGPRGSRAKGLAPWDPMRRWGKDYELRGRSAGACRRRTVLRRCEVFKRGGVRRAGPVFVLRSFRMFSCTSFQAVTNQQPYATFKSPLGWTPIGSMV